MTRGTIIAPRNKSIRVSGAQPENARTRFHQVTGTSRTRVETHTRPLSRRKSIDEAGQ